MPISRDDEISMRREGAGEYVVVVGVGNNHRGDWFRLHELRKFRIT